MDIYLLIEPLLMFREQAVTKTILYARVSTVDQTAAHQLTQAKGAGFKIDEVITDDGVSGVSTILRERPQGRRLFDKLREGDVLVVRWVDRLGRNYLDVCDTIREFMRRGVIIKTVINGLVFDGATKNPMEMAVRDALVAFMAAMAQAQTEANKLAQKAGIAHVRAAEPRAYLGRKPDFTGAQLDAICAAGDAVGSTDLAATLGLPRQTVYRLRRNPAAARAILTRWEGHEQELAERRRRRKTVDAA